MRLPSIRLERLEIVGQMIDAAELWDADARDASLQLRAQARSDHLGLAADALAIVLDEHVGQNALGHIGVGFPTLAEMRLPVREAPAPQDCFVVGHMLPSPMGA